MLPFPNMPDLETRSLPMLALEIENLKADIADLKFFIARLERKHARTRSRDFRR